ncbi:Zn-ribbon domain-containing OB-fold protein [Chloroflexota bacterium]
MESRKVPLEKELFTIPSSPQERPSLLASQCENCGEIIFPRQPNCPNCTKTKLKVINLSRKGKVEKSTIVRHRPQLYEGPIPYIVGEVRLPEGVNIPSIIKGWDMAEPPPYGLEVELDLDKIEVDEEGNEVMMYSFKPLS